MQFEFATANRIIFGPGAAKKALPEAAKAMGVRPLLVIGRHSPLPYGSGVRYIVTGEPTIQTARDGVALYRREGCDFVLAVGGGSVIDAGKAVAALVTTSGEPLDYLEVVGRGGVFEHAPAPFLAAPTTAGTGSEVTRNAVLGVPEQKVKASLRGQAMLPKVAIVDPELCLGLPPEITVFTGLDALTQMIEPFVSIRANAMTDLYCLEGMRRVRRSLRNAFHDGPNLEARTDMSYASLLGGLALANAGLGVVHGFAAPIGGMFPAPHGGVCAALLPHGMRANIRALRSRASGHEALQRYKVVAEVLTGNSDAEPEAGVDWVAQLCADLNVAPLSRYGITAANVDELSEKAAKASSMKANPLPLSPEELKEVVASALELS